VSITSTDAFEAKPAAYRASELILLRVGPAVQDFNGIDQAKDLLPTDLLQELTGVGVVFHLPPERMGEHDDAAHLVDQFPNVAGMVHPKPVFMKSEDQQVSFIGADLHAAEYREIVLLPEPVDVFLGPVPVMLSETDTIQASGFCAENRIFRVEVAIIRSGSCVAMQVDYHECPRPL